MISREASWPPDNSAPSTPALLVFSNTPPPNRNLKRKHATVSGTASANAASPAPSDPGFSGVQSGERRGVAAANADTSPNRPRLTVSRPPVFVPVSEGSIYHTLTEQTPVNRLLYRFSPAGLTEPGSKIPYRTIESNPAGYVRVSWEDRSPLIKVTTDGLGLCGEKGFRSARLNVPIREGKWYMEVRVELGGGDRASDSTMRDGAHVRLGWGRLEARLDAPAGLDGYSYAYRDKTGDKITLARPRPYGETFKSGDVIGMYISLPPKRKADPRDPNDPAHMKRERIAIDFRGQEYFEVLEYSQSKEMISLLDSANNRSKPTASLPSSSKKSTGKTAPGDIPKRGSKPVAEPDPLQPLPRLRGSNIAFFVNGKCQGMAFDELFDYLQLRRKAPARKDKNKRRLREGIQEHFVNNFDDGWLGYYPFISLYNGARVRINAGPDFDFPPPADIEGLLANVPDSADTKTRTWRPVCERYAEFMAEQWAMDEQEEAEARAETQQGEEQEQEYQKKEHARKSEQRGLSQILSQSRGPPKSHKPEHKPQAAPSPQLVTTPQPLPSPTPQLLIPPQPPVQAQPQMQTPETTMSEAELKLAARRERKRVMEKARRARKAEEARAAKAKAQAEAEAAQQLAALSSMSITRESTVASSSVSAEYVDDYPMRDYAQSPAPTVDSILEPDMY